MEDWITIQNKTEQYKIWNAQNNLILQFPCFEPYYICFEVIEKKY